MKKYSAKSVYSIDGNLLPIEQRTFKTNEGYDCVLIGCGTTEGKVTVSINNWISEFTLSMVKKGSIKNPFHPSVHNIGFLGEGAYTPRIDNKVSYLYTLWTNMLGRVYSEAYHKKRPTYKDVTVCEEWHNFQNFAKWVETESNYQTGWELDKDLLAIETKTYSPSTCLFIPQKLNSFMTNIQSDNKSGFPGISWVKDRDKWAVETKCVRTNKRLRLGNYANLEEAIQVYRTARRKNVLIWQEKLNGILPQTALNNLH